MQSNTCFMDSLRREGYLGILVNIAFLVGDFSSETCQKPTVAHRNPGVLDHVVP